LKIGRSNCSAVPAALGVEPILARVESQDRVARGVDGLFVEEERRRGSIDVVESITSRPLLLADAIVRPARRRSSGAIPEISMRNTRPAARVEPGDFGV